MAEGSLAPAELDRLEDALEGLEDDAALERWLTVEPSETVRERLTSYRSILDATREAMPIEEVPSGVLDGVIAEAQRAAAVAPVAAAAKASWWQRMRGSYVVPAVALAGTAVLVLWVGQPNEAGVTATAPVELAEGEASRSRAKLDETVDAAAPAKEEAAGRAAPAPAAQAPPQDAEGIKGVELGATLEARPEEDAQAQQEVTPDVVPEVASNDKKMGTLGEAPGTKPVNADPKPTPTTGAAGPANGRWDIISRGDRARQEGDCIAARDEYAVALEDDDPAVRARAFAGLGLCDASMGATASADGNFERARELDGEIGVFIDSQQQRKPPRSKKRSKSKRKASRPAPKSDTNNAALDQLDPFNP
ncbi:MAG: hypothetical protein K0V04_22110 [Deltaproteobacteria bacterium]|nr:hypothetical protein [Deltaproteobacteria bacterium]